MIDSTAWTLALVVLAVGAHGQGADQTATLPEALRAHLGSERFTPVASVAALPAGVRDGLKTLFGGTLEMAEPGAPFQATDNVTMPRLPWRRLVAAGCAADHCLVYYEKGGYAHVFYALVFRTSTAGTTLEFGGTAPGGLSDLEAVKAAVAAGKVAGQTKTKYW